MLNLKEQNIAYLPGVGPARAKILKDELGICTWHDLLYFFPYKHIDRTRLYRIAELSADMPYVQVKGQFVGFEQLGEGRKKRLVGHFSDGQMMMDLTWFNSIKYILSSIKLHKPYIIFGRPSLFNGRIQVSHPEIDEAEKLTLSTMGMQPYYSVTEKMKKRGYNSRSIERLTQTLFQQLQEPLAETLPPEMLQQLNLVPLNTALRAAHYPTSAAALAGANQRLKFEELFYVQLSILKYARTRSVLRGGHRMPRVGEMFHRFYSQYLPFSLTEAQKRVVREMRADMCSDKQMNRLLQGDVGSGKTLVALLLLLLAIDNGYQGCIMAPTEILAEQHLDTFRNMLGDMPVRVELLTGMVKGKRRREVMAGLENGEVHILVGTHAVIEDKVAFQRLGLVIIDEQHRFGVAQRARLWEKNLVPPHVLVMTATPIPRTLAMTLYGDLSVSVIDELPPGRKPIKTLHRNDEHAAALYRDIHQQVSQGRQVYVVYPLIKESEKIDLKNVEEGRENLQKVFPGFKIGMVHGKMKPQEKDEEMRRFVAGETQILVATTVIEVGVNVPNASVMVIQNAERFGLSQLHQLRGRVGRGADQSYCILVSKYKLNPISAKRIAIMTETNDGFEIAEADLKLRGPGEMEGTKQSGMAFELKLANLARDGQLVQWARDTASHILDQDPDLSWPTHAILKTNLEEMRKDKPDWSAIS